MRVLVTGHLGYVGSVLTPLLTAQGHEVIGMDLGWFADCLAGTDTAVVPSIREDIRRARPEHFSGVDAVIHLAALSNDPLGDLDPDLTKDINVAGTQAVLLAAARAGVRQLVFASSCAVYGKGDGERELDEDTPPSPVSAYAASKAEAEGLVAAAADRMRTTILRTPTIYGMSPRLRLDLAVNEMVANGLVRGKVELRAPGASWRPLMRVEDFCRAMVMVLTAPPSALRHACYNLGAEDLNCRWAGLAAVAAAQTGAQLLVVPSSSHDPRSYRVGFRRIKEDLPDFVAQPDLALGIGDLAAAYRSIGLGEAELSGDRYRRLPWLIRILER